ncbi:histidine kinase [Pseudoalteromonas sp. MMG010]|uniref:sensor histidine kinase n=1 Tax=Pseudoalteromonas sp. MMG010 TaxID=2822685 RepID=UPI001B3A3715|nr:histidine kinase [Pseudoalteromonas sp. MMG010]MBQ4833065.1 histidine kinase [Pseudoalteromonas sp. MMG010]
MSKQRQQDALLFSALFNERGILSLLVVTQVIAIILALAPNRVGGVWYYLAINSMFLHTTVIVSCYCLYLLRSFLSSLNPALQLTSFIIVFTFNAGLFSLLFAHTVFSISTAQQLLIFMLCNMFSVFLLATLFVQFLVIHYDKNKQTHALSRAELDALQARIRPHFLYNSLNTAAELTHYDASAAEQSLLGLAALSQAAMRAGKSVALEDELTLCKQYLNIEKWRFNQRLNIDWLLPEHIPNIAVPCLTLQPLIENAVIHGVEPSLSPVNIKVELHVTANYLTIIVSNPIANNPPEHREGNGMALENIRQRLNIFYQHKAKLTIAKKDNTFRVKVVLPKRLMVKQ